MRTLRVKLLVDEEERRALFATMEAYTEAYNIAATWGYFNQTANRREVHRGTYRLIRDTVKGLPAMLVETASFDACANLKMAKLKRKPQRRQHAAIRYAGHTMRIHMRYGFISMSTVRGRITSQFKVPDCYKKYLEWWVKSSLLMYSKSSKSFYLGIVVEMETPRKTKDIRVLGIDRGLRNIAVCSDNTFFDSRHIRGVRGRYAKNKRELQAKGTRSAKRRLRQQAGREKRFMACENHRISKVIANSEYSVFALEDLGKIKVGKNWTREAKKKLNHWSYYELQQDLRYKAESLGKWVVFVDPTCTSQWCSRCGLIRESNRQGNWFRCQRCGLQLDADLNASRNIARLGKIEMGRLSVNQPNATGGDGGRFGSSLGGPEPSCKLMEERGQFIIPNRIQAPPRPRTVDTPWPSKNG